MTALRKKNTVGLPVFKIVLYFMFPFCSLDVVVYRHSRSLPFSNIALIFLCFQAGHILSIHSKHKPRLIRWIIWSVLLVSRFFRRWRRKQKRQTSFAMKSTNRFIHRSIDPSILCDPLLRSFMIEPPPPPPPAKLNPNGINFT